MALRSWRIYWELQTTFAEAPSSSARYPRYQLRIASINSISIGTSISSDPKSWKSSRTVILYPCSSAD